MKELAEFLLKAELGEWKYFVGHEVKGENMIITYNDMGEDEDRTLTVSIWEALNLIVFNPPRPKIYPLENYD